MNQNVGLFVLNIITTCHYSLTFTKEFDSFGCTLFSFYSSKVQLMVMAMVVVVFLGGAYGTLWICTTASEMWQCPVCRCGQTFNLKNTSTFCCSWSVLGNNFLHWQLQVSVGLESKPLFNVFLLFILELFVLLSYGDRWLMRMAKTNNTNWENF